MTRRAITLEADWKVGVFTLAVKRTFNADRLTVNDVANGTITTASIIAARLTNPTGALDADSSVDGTIVVISAVNAGWPTRSIDAKRFSRRTTI